MAHVLGLKLMPRGKGGEIEHAVIGLPVQPDTTFFETGVSTV